MVAPGMDEFDPERGAALYRTYEERKWDKAARSRPKR
jgi:hypothetical protein